MRYKNKKRGVYEKLHINFIPILYRDSFRTD